MSGRLMGLVPGSVRVFSFRAGEATYTVLEQVPDDDRESVAPGVEHLRKTFEVTSPAAP